MRNRIVWSFTSRNGHFVYYTVAFALPASVVLFMELHSRHALTWWSGLLMVFLSCAFGFLASYASWMLYFRNRSLPRD